jgi:uncharacterized membrane protein YjfL (UPF0719 family)
MDFNLNQQDAIVFIVAFISVYVGMNVYNKENQKSADYNKSLQYALLGALICLAVSMAYAQQSKSEVKLDEPFNS